MTSTEREAQFFTHSMHSGYGGQLPPWAHLCNHMLSRGTAAENVAKLTEFLCEAMKFRHEEAMLEGFEWLCRAWERFDKDIERQAAGGVEGTPSVEAFTLMKLDRMIDLYALTPHGEGCMMLKVAIIQKAVREFFRPERTEVAKKAFSFFLAMAYRTHEGDKVEHPYLEVRERLAGRDMPKTERVAVENAVREAMVSWKLEDIEAWYREWKGKWGVPADILNQLAIAWVKVGG